MTDSTFRTAQPAEPVAPPAPVSDAPVETGGKEVSVPDLLVSYEVDQGKPYVADYFDMPTAWDREPSMERDLREIDGYIQDQVKSGTLDNSIKAASTFLKEMERAAGLTRYESVNQRISKLLAYIDFKRVVNG